MTQSDDPPPGGSATGYHRRWQAGRPWVHDMVIAHRFYRIGLGLLPDAIAAVRPGDVRRARHLRNHYLMIVRSMGRHQTYENAHFWPMLAQRVNSEARRVEHTVSSHRSLVERIDALAPLWAEWTATAAPEAAQRLLVDLHKLIEKLNRVLDEEERDMLPLIEEFLTVEEWTEFGRYSAASAPKRQLVLMAGMVAGALTAPEIEDMTRQQPTLVWAVRHIGYPYYRRYARALGFPPPAPLQA